MTVDHVLPRSAPVTLLRCAACGAAFLEDRTVPAYETELSGMLDYYIEQGGGIDLMVEPLFRVPPQSVRRSLEIGCGYGFALDFSRFAFGWDVLGVDPSSLAVAGAADLDLPIRFEYYRANPNLGREPFDLILCSEILEHVDEPYALLTAIREGLSSDGVLVLSTPNVAVVREESGIGVLGRALSPGLHLVLYDRASLEFALTKAGFEAVIVEESEETLRAFAGSHAALARLQPIDANAQRTMLRRYLDARADTAPRASALACGFAYRHLKECVNAGLYADATISRDRLVRVYRERFGVELAEPMAVAESSPFPFNATGTLFFCGILELNHEGRPDRAAEYFEAAIRAGAMMQSERVPFGVHDGETEGLLNESRKHLPMALAAFDAERAVRELDVQSLALPRRLLSEAFAQTFVRLVNAGAYDAAEQLAPRIRAQIDFRALEEHGETTPGALDPLYCLAMLALHQSRNEEAAALFAQVQRSASRSASPRAQLVESARDHEALSRERLAAESAER